MDFEKWFGEMPMPVAIVDPLEDEVVYVNRQARERFLFDLSKSRKMRDFIVPQYHNDLVVLKHLIETERRAVNYHLELKDGGTVSVNGNYLDGYFVYYFVTVDYVPARPQGGETFSYSEIMGSVVQDFCSSRDTTNILYAILKTVSLYLGVDRAYIFEVTDNDTFKCTHEFLNEGIASNIQAYPRVPVGEVDSFGRFARGLSKIVYNSAEQTEEGDIHARPKDVKSYVHLPILDGDDLIGFAGFDICGEFHTWTAGERKVFEGVTSVIKEMLLKQRLEESARRSSHVMTTVLDNVDVFMYVIDFETYELLFANRALRDFIGENYESGNPCWRVLRPDMQGPCPFCQKNQLIGSNGVPTGMRNTHDLYNEYAKVWLYVTETMIEWTDGRRAVLLTALDINNRKELEQELQYRASTDMMTSAYSRSWGLRVFKERYDDAMKRGKSITVCFADINKLKQVNDRFGHDVGDTLIQTVSGAIRQNLSISDCLIRLGGDEFLVVFENSDIASAEDKINGVVKRLDEINSSSGFPFECSISYGIESASPDCNLTVDDVISHADAKMYAQKKLYSAKNAGR